MSTSLGPAMANASGQAQLSRRPDAIEQLAATVAIASAGGVVEIGLACALVLDPSRFAAVLLAHGILVLALGLWAWSMHRTGNCNRVYLLFVVTTAALGAIGVLGSMLVIGLTHVFARSATSFESWYASLAPEPTTNPIQALYEQIEWRDARPGDRSSVAPFTDVIASGTVEQKQTVITLIVDNFRTEFASALQAALNDAEPAIRVQAATACARIEGQFLERAMILEGRHAGRPDDAAALRELARHHDEYASTGLLDHGRASQARQRALELYRQCDCLEPGEPETEKSIGRLLLRLDQNEAAATWLEPLVEEDTASAQLLAWYIESLYRLGRFSLLQHTCRRFRSRLVHAADLNDDVRQAVILWADSALPAKERT